MRITFSTIGDDAGLGATSAGDGATAAVPPFTPTGARVAAGAVAGVVSARVPAGRVAPGRDAGVGGCTAGGVTTPAFERGGAIDVSHARPIDAVRFGVTI